jgi:UDP-N-acetylglucosamine transferase subunit ALG13
MIFVTVGTHEQQFNRLIEYVDNIKRIRLIEEEVVIQTGFSTYKPSYCTWKKLFPYQEMLEYIAMARIIITHGGPSSFIMPLQAGKTPIVVPRQKKYNEHVNDHQISFAQEVEKRMGTIIVVVDINSLGDIILNYDMIKNDMPYGTRSNNAKFNANLEKIVDEMLQGRKKKR